MQMAGTECFGPAAFPILECAFLCTGGMVDGCSSLIRYSKVRGMAADLSEIASIKHGIYFGQGFPPAWKR